MPLTLEEARAKVNEHVGPYEEVRDPVRTTTFGWVFTIGVTPGEEIFGGWDLIGIESDGGRLIEHGACVLGHGTHDHETEQQYYTDLIEAWELGYRYERYDITVGDVRDAPATVALLEPLGLGFVVPEQYGGRTWRIPQYFTATQLELVIADAPVTFTGQHASPIGLRTVVDEAVQTAVCSISVEPGDIGPHHFRGMGPAPPGATPASM